ncbi:hypothetical protein E5676_scaffold333G00220 [Cucumis melo var. makuwa]|uniref:Uncharacterized protein n=1 Tax=Cucumis melo var. makuwa TaxID=1194695 RepID=A0A5D3DF50_CUCMM|nr:hypothetical protein E6C27_scaffold219G00540 [Cucumis melo var. makuwa]TYK22165.1 hypothetical protein E5676_scaffold333G00220 [Cucumis melo var. makuwa]
MSTTIGDPPPPSYPIRSIHTLTGNSLPFNQIILSDGQSVKIIEIGKLSSQSLCLSRKALTWLSSLFPSLEAIPPETCPQSSTHNNNEGTPPSALRLEFDSSTATSLLQHDGWVQFGKYHLRFLNADLLSSYHCQQTAYFGA